MTDEQDVKEQYAAARARWVAAVAAHCLAGPDGAFSARLWEVAAATREQARAIARVAGSGWAWPGGSTDGGPPHELSPDSRRRGAKALWREFDAALAGLLRAWSGSDPYRVARANNRPAAITEQLAADVARLERDSGLLGPQ